VTEGFEMSRIRVWHIFCKQIDGWC